MNIFSRFLTEVFDTNISVCVSKIKNIEDNYNLDFLFSAFFFLPNNLSSQIIEYFAPKKIFDREFHKDNPINFISENFFILIPSNFEELDKMFIVVKGEINLDSLNAETNYFLSSATVLLLNTFKRQEIIDLGKKKISDDLKASEERLRMALASSGQALWEWNLKTDEMFVDEQFNKIFGFPPGHPAQSMRFYSSFFHPADTTLLNQRLEQFILANNGGLYQVEYRIKRVDGEYVWVLSRGKVVKRTSKGKPLVLLGTIEDVTAIKIVDNEIKERNARIKAIVDSAIDGIVSVDSSGLIESFNPAAEHLFGYKAEEIIGKPFDNCVEFPRKFSFKNLVEKLNWKVTDKVLSNKYEVKGLRKNGTSFPAELAVSHFIVDEKKIFTGMVRDVSERKKHEDDLNNLTLKLRAIIENTADSIYSIDTHYRIITLNDNYRKLTQKLFGVELNPGDNHLHILPAKSSEEWKLLYNQAFAGSRFTIERRYVIESKNYQAEIHFNPILNAEQIVTGCAVYFRDVTESKKLLNELIESKKIAEDSMRAKEQFLAHMSHEIRTPMNAVLGMAHLLRQLNPSAEQDRFLKVIEASSQNLLVIINDILDFSKIEAGKILFSSEPFSLAEILDAAVETIKYYALEKHLNIFYEIQSDVPKYLKGDQVRLNQVLLNLLSNAVKFTDLGEVAVYVSFIEFKDSMYHIRFMVKDTGVGIPKDKVDKIFESFEQIEANSLISKKGTGLGLAIVKGLVTRQGGRVKVESTLNVGSSFFVEIPFHPSTKEEVLKSKISFKNTAKTSEDYNLKGIRVLIVEDNEMNQLVASNMLKLWGAKFEIAANGQDALQILTYDSAFDLVLMDLSMPVLDGYQATKAIRANYPEPLCNIPIIALTASALSSAQDKVFEVGMNDFVTKPFRPDELKGKIFASVNRTRPPRTTVELLEPVPSLPVAEPAGYDDFKYLAPSVDLDNLMEFAGGDKDFIKEMIDNYLVNLPAATDEIEKSYNENRIEDLRAQLHKLKPTLSYIGSSHLFTAVERIEKDLKKSENLDKINDVMPVIIQCLKDVPALLVFHAGKLDD
ncbi:MAG: PAS domain S-box protein [Ignavibacteriaceae bacterium]|nr:PAS domain S-box protein [Ignavibacteriaceae bacterium]